MVMRPQILHRQLWNQNYDFQLFLHVVSHNLKLKLWHIWFCLNFPNAHNHIFHSLEVKILIFMWFFMVFQGFWSNTTLFSSCCWHRYAVFSCVFHVFGFQFTDHPFGKLENVFRVWSLVAKKWRKHHQSYMYGTFWDKKCHIHVRSEFSILRHKKYNLIFTMLCSGVDNPECTHTQIRYEYSISRGLCQSPPIDFFRCICFESRCWWFILILIALPV